MLCIIIPAHNEEAYITQCLTAAHTAGRHAALDGEEVKVIVVADDCFDRTGSLASASGAILIETDGRNVGLARATGANAAILLGARWLAFTDADSIVSPNWLVDQLLCQADVVCGTVNVRNWPTEAEAARDRFSSTYSDLDGHRHVHGANLGVSATAYQKAGGFPPLLAHEDVALVKALESIGASICWSAAPRVTTSARLQSKTGAGFGATLQLWNILPSAPHFDMVYASIPMREPSQMDHAPLQPEVSERV